MRTLALLLLVVAALIVDTAAAAAAQRVAVNLELSGRFTGPNSIAGTFTSRVGTIEDSGTYTQTFGLDGNRVDTVKVLTGSQGIIVIYVRAFADFVTPTTATFHGGHWKLLFGTGVYAGITGGGRPGAASGIADLAAGTEVVSHRGKARLRARR